jgi:prophage antirepressor-like protein
VAAPFSTWSRKILEHTLNPSEIHPHFTPTVFTRHNRFLHTFMHANQAWFCVQDLGRLMGRPLDQRLTLKLDPDQRQQVLLLRNGKTTESLMVSESGMYALLVHHFVPENRNLRQWLSNEVIPTLRESGAAVDNIPSLSSLQWAGVSVPLLHWQHQAWIKWRDMPDLMQVQRPLKILGTCS